VKQVTSGDFLCGLVARNGLAISALVGGWCGKDTGDGPATSTSAIRKVLAIEEAVAIKEDFATKEVLAIEEVLAIKEVLAIGKQPEFVAVEAGRRHGKVFSSGVARGSL
jgi:hypothetical protein